MDAKHAAEEYLYSLEDASGTTPPTFVTPLDQVSLDIDPEEVKEEGFWDTKKAENLSVWYDNTVETALENDVVAWLEVRDDITAKTEDVVSEVFRLFGLGKLVPDTDLEDMLNDI